MKAQAWEGAQFDSGGQLTAQEAAGVFEACEYFTTACRPFHRRDIDLRKSQFPVNFDIGDENLVQARVTDLPDKHFRELLADTVRNALETDDGWHDSVCDCRFVILS